jgi:hypothetical protein
MSKDLRGSDFVGSPNEIIEKILSRREIFHLQYFLMNTGNNTIDHKKKLHDSCPAGVQGNYRMDTTYIGRSGLRIN